MFFPEGTQFSISDGPSKWDLALAVMDKTNHPVAAFTWLPIDREAFKWHKDKRATVEVAGEIVGKPGTFWVRLLTWYNDVEYLLEGEYSITSNDGASTREGHVVVVRWRELKRGAVSQEDIDAAYPDGVLQSDWAPGPDQDLRTSEVQKLGWPDIPGPDTPFFGRRSQGSGPGESEDLAIGDAPDLHNEVLKSIWRSPSVPGTTPPFLKNYLSPNTHPKRRDSE